MKRYLICITILALTLSFSGIAYSGDPDDNNQRSGSNGALTGGLLGGLLGGGLGTAIGSASGHAGTGALIGAGIGALGGALIGSQQQANQQRAQAITAQEQAQQQAQWQAQQVQPPQPVNYVPMTVSDNQQPKKTIIRQYDAQGNVVSEKEVTQ